MMAPPIKTIAQYMLEAAWEGDCHVHPSTANVSRKIYILRHGPLTPQQYVCHRCDNPKCILDAHHFIGTCGDNVRDAVVKGRHSGFRKGGARFSRLRTEDEKARISEGLKRAYAEGRR